MARRDDLENNPEFLADLRNPTIKKSWLMETYNCSSSFIVDRRKELTKSGVTFGVTPTSLTDEKQSLGVYQSVPSGRQEFNQDVKGNVTITKTADRIIPLDEWLDDLRGRGFDPDHFTYSYGNSVWQQTEEVTLYANRFSATKKPGAVVDGPAWPVIQPAAPVTIHASEIPAKPARNELKLSLKCSDPQIGFRALSDGTLEEFHDWDAMNVFAEVCRREQPESIIILGDFLDLASQGKYVQEAGFARTTQMALDVGHTFLSLLRGLCPAAEIVLVEGNHDKRMQNFIEMNALAAFGLRQANMPESWPVMSIPNLLRLEDLGIIYMDAYPAAAHWDDDNTRNIHGTRANSKGSTMSQYANDLPHINTWAGHTHRVEIVYKSVLGPRGEAIESYAANTGCLAKTDGSVPSVHGALHSDGSSARVVEDWQQGFGALLFDGAGQSWPQVYRIRNGKTLYNGQMIAA